MTTRIFIDGAAGTTGLKIRDRLAGRAEFELLVLDDAQRKDERARREAIHEADIAILCLPDAAAREAVKLATGSNTRIIDASSAHRTADGWTYGFPELVGNSAVANAQFVANPGCYPTGFLALIAPLVRNKLLPSDWPYTVHAVSGYSGGGNALIERFEGDSEIAFRAYGLQGSHKHLPEMQQHAGLAYPPVFSPSVVSTFRGMLIEIPLNLHAMGIEADQAELFEHGLFEFYKDSPMVEVDHQAENPKELILPDASDWDHLELHVYLDAQRREARLVARLDNLGKGASGAAIQNLNIMCGLDETAGLRTYGLVPA